MSPRQRSCFDVLSVWLTSHWNQPFYPCGPSQINGQQLSLSFGGRGGAGGGRGVQIQLVYPNNAVHVFQAIRFARGLWGRMFLSIIPAYTRMPLELARRTEV
jgi:hypothetical protein